MSETEEEEKEEEKVVFKVGANLFRGMELVGGWMHISRGNIRFLPHKMNLQNKPLEIRMHQIKELQKRNTLLVVPNGMKVILKNGKSYRFVVWNREKIMAFISESMMDTEIAEQQAN
jgi:hypothetical protein